MYDWTTIQPYKVLLLTCVINCNVGMPSPRLCSVVQWSVHRALSQMTWVLVLAKALCPWDVWEKKNGSSTFRLGLIFILIILTPQHENEFSYLTPWSFLHIYQNACNVISNSLKCKIFNTKCFIPKKIWITSNRSFYILFLYPVEVCCTSSLL